MQPKDITRLVTLGAPTLSPDGRYAVVAVTRVDAVEDDYRSSLWAVATDGSAPPRRLTYGAHDSEPRYSPDGAWLAYLARAGEAKAQVHLLPTAGGEARAITELPLGAGGGQPVQWAPDSSAIAFVARVPDTDRYGTNEKVPADKEPPRRITGLTYRRDNLGFLTDRRSHVFVVDLAALGRDDGAGLDGFCRQVTFGDADDSDVRWTADGRLLFLSARHDDREHDRVQDVFVVGRDGSGRRRLTDGTLSIGGVQITGDPNTLLVAAEPYDRDASWLCRNVGLWRVTVGDAPATPVRLTDTETVHLGDSWIVVGGDRALVAVENRGAVDVVSVAIDGAPGSGVRTVVAGRRQIGAIDRAGDVLVATYSDTSTSGELARIDGSDLVRLTDFGADVAPVLLPITEIEATAPDGHPVHGFLAVPEGDGPHPVLLMIHGGPFTQYGWTNLDEAQVYAAAGYAVVYGNPRGSSGYGEAHGRFIVGDVGPKQTPDVLALLDAVLERPDLDGSRVGVLGGSHGGYMTTWLVGHDDRFRAAVSERAVNAIDSFEGSSDIGWDFADALYGTDPEQRRRQSPLTYADDIHTPLLIVHSEQDWRCPIEQAQRLYVALRKRDADVELLLFPGEGHELSRSGVPSHRIARFEAIVEWFGRYL